MSNRESLRPVILITVYDRYNHIKQCIESIENADGVECFDIIIGSDNASCLGHQQSINEVRSYLEKKLSNHRFNNFTVIDHKDNVGESENLKTLHNEAKKSGFKTFIHMEDDVVVGRYFLEFMEDALNIYKDETDVVAVRAYRDPSEEKYRQQTFLSNRMCAYGYASWYKKWERVCNLCDSHNYASIVLQDFKLFRGIVRYSANGKSYPFLAEGLYSASDIEIGLMMEVEKLKILCSPESLTANRGLDGSGLRSGVDENLQRMEPSNKKIKITEPEDIKFIPVQKASNPIRFKLYMVNWLFYFIYRYIPFGYRFLRWVRSVYKSRSLF
ncbi:MAG: hypothetical protein AWU56_1274 [Idiomarina sp. T82-3]|uniref:glycosyltransferase family 2 protein n=1 Tax=Idiomarina TaxID=135575 RepID=UPI00079C2C93|nr:hypothetical protein [Idiomarina sp. T82-3]KXS35303.1 MAG: hypothetical protein AWU56_1274 [Idiomarina sp. T82-3]